MIPSPNICQVNVGGTQFAFSRASFEQHHMQESIISTTVLGRNSDVVPFFDVDPELFKKWIAPYIRQEVLPTQVGLESPHDREHLIRAANTVGLIALAQYVEQMGATKIKIPYCVFLSNDSDTPSGVKYFFCCQPSNNKYFTSIHCPDLVCDQQFAPTGYCAISFFLNHFRGFPHNGTVTVHEEHNGAYGKFKHGIIECEIKKYKELSIEETTLVHKKESE